MSYGDVPAGAEFADQPLTVLSGEEKTWGMLCHLSTLLSYLAAGLTFIGPLVCWLVKKDTSKFVDYHGKESLNFQLNILIYYLLTMAVTVATCGITFPLPLGVLIWSIVMPILAGLAANKGELYRYPLTFRMIK